MASVCVGAAEQQWQQLFDNNEAVPSDIFSANCYHTSVW